ncbi:MAG: hypothetical protein E6K69_08340, partial [Nitrospirae bacterium]
IKVIELDVQDPKAAAALAEYPEARWAEVTRRAIKIGLAISRVGRRPERYFLEAGFESSA